jgi:hypothetical protein
MLRNPLELRGAAAIECLLVIRRECYSSINVEGKIQSSGAAWLDDLGLSRAIAAWRRKIRSDIAIQAAPLLRGRREFF